MHACMHGAEFGIKTVCVQLRVSLHGSEVSSLMHSMHGELFVDFKLHCIFEQTKLTIV